MQNELVAENPQTLIRVLGVNQTGSESGNPLMCDGRDLPWLQDDNNEQAWVEWEVRYRDVYIVDETNRKVDVFNLTDYDLADPDNYAELKRLLKQAAGE